MTTFGHSCSLHGGLHIKNESKSCLTFKCGKVDVIMVYVTKIDDTLRNHNNIQVFA